ncbi:MAG: MarR family transcriptional regulator [Chloroflexota bacterium]
MFERCLYFNSNALVRKVNRIWKDAYAELGLSPSHAYLLRLVLAQPGLSQNQIAVELQLEKSTVTRFIDKMETEGYLTRTVSKQRVTREQKIYPTDKAKAIHDRLEGISQRLYDQMRHIVGEDAMPTLVNELREVAQAL